MQQHTLGVGALGVGGAEGDVHDGPIDEDGGHPEPHRRGSARTVGEEGLP